MKARTVFAFMFYAAYLWMIAVEHINPPPELHAIVHLMMGFYFGQRSKKGGIK